jgi:hypothetical protein
MADAPSDPRSKGGRRVDGGDPLDDESPSLPRWVVVFGMVAAILVLLFVVLHVAGAGLGRHPDSSSHTKDSVQRP